MNFVDEAVLTRLFPSSVNQTTKELNKVLAKTNVLVYRIAKTALDVVRIYSGGSATIKPEHFHNVAKIAQVLRTPVNRDKPDSSTSMLRGGGGGGGDGGTGGPEGGWGDCDYNNANRGVLDSFDIRAPMVADASAFGITNQVGGHPVLPLRYFQEGGRRGITNQVGGHPVLPLRYFQEGGSGIRDGSSSASSSSKHGLSDAAVQAIVKEYKARSGCTELRMSEPARAVLRTLIDANLSLALNREIRKKPTAAAVDKILRHWTLVL